MGRIRKVKSLFWKEKKSRFSEIMLSDSEEESGFFNLRASSYFPKEKRFSLPTPEEATSDDDSYAEYSTVPMKCVCGKINSNGKECHHKCLCGKIFLMGEKCCHVRWERRSPKRENNKYFTVERKSVDIVR